MCFHSAGQIGVSRMWKSRIAITSLSPPPINQAKSSQTTIADYLCYTCNTTFTSAGGGNAHKVTGDRTRVPVPVWIAAQFVS
jgi:hypothetical protein